MRSINQGNQGSTVALTRPNKLNHKIRNHTSPIKYCIGLAHNNPKIAKSRNLLMKKRRKRQASRHQDSNSRILLRMILIFWQIYRPSFRLKSSGSIAKMLEIFVNMQIKNGKI